MTRTRPATLAPRARVAPVDDPSGHRIDAAPERQRLLEPQHAARAGAGDQHAAREASPHTSPGSTGRARSRAERSRPQLRVPPQPAAVSRAYALGQTAEDDVEADVAGRVVRELARVGHEYAARGRTEDRRHDDAGVDDHADAKRAQPFEAAALFEMAEREAVRADDELDAGSSRRMPFDQGQERRELAWREVGAAERDDVDRQMASGRLPRRRRDRAAGSFASPPGSRPGGGRYRGQAPQAAAQVGNADLDPFLRVPCRPAPPPESAPRA